MSLLFLSFLFLGGLFLDLADHFFDELGERMKGSFFLFLSFLFLLFSLFLEPRLSGLYLSVGLANLISLKIDRIEYSLLILLIVFSLFFLFTSYTSCLIIFLYLASALFDERREFRDVRPFLKFSSFLTFIKSLDPLSFPSVLFFDLGYLTSNLLLFFSSKSENH